MDWDPRVVIDYGFAYKPVECPPDGRAYRVWETWIAFTTKRRVAVCISERPATDPSSGEFIPCSAAGMGLRMAFGDNESAAWSWSGFIPGQPTGSSVEDPVILVRDPNPGAPSDPEFILWSKTVAGVHMTTWRPSTGFGAWHQIASSGAPTDKPWAVRGSADEFYLVWFDQGSPPAIHYRRSEQNGSPNTWYGGPVQVNGNTVTSNFCAQPTVAGDGSLYVAFRPGGNAWHFLQGVDASGSLVSWSFLLQSSTSSLQYPFRLLAGLKLPVAWESNGGSTPQQNKPVPFLLTDPTNPDHLYLVYHDVAESDSQDMNVYCARLQRSGAIWSYGPGDILLVNTVNTPDGSGVRPDSFLPSAAIDRFGRIHVIFYDNRLACGSSSHEGVYDAYYAVSQHDASSELVGFSDYLLRDCSQHAFMDTGLLIPSDSEFFEGWHPHEYNGIFLDDSGHQTIVFASYSMLVSGEDPSLHPSAIGATRIVVSNPGP